WYAVGFGGESGLRKLGLCGIHPLTQRYIFNQFSSRNHG
ncbi:glutathione S-transferase, partial [Vibrio vulnificus]